MKSQGLLSIAVLSMGNMVGMVASAVALILFSRFMGPSEFGVFSAAFAAMQIAVRFTDMGFSLAAERSISRVFKSDPDLADRYMRVSFWLKIAISVLVCLAGWILSPWLAVSVLHLPDAGYLRLAVLLSVDTVFFEYTMLIFQSTQRFSRVAQIMVAQGIGKLIIGLILVWEKSLTAVSALLIYGLMPLFAAGMFWKKSHLHSFRLPVSWKKDLSVISNIAKWTAFAAIASTLAENFDIIVVQAYLTSYDTGLWSAAARIALFGVILGNSVNSVLANRVAHYHDRVHLDQYLAKAWKLALGSFLVVCLAIPLSRIAMLITAGSAYLPAVGALKILLLSDAVTVATAPYIALFYLFDKPKYYTIAGFLQIFLFVAGDIFFIPIFGLTGAAWVRVGVKVVILLFTVYYAYKTYRELYPRLDNREKAVR